MSRQEALDKELQQLKQINHIVGDIITSVRTTHENLGTTNESMENTNKLVDQWIRILSQADYTKEMLLNLDWQGDDDINQKIDDKLEKEKELQQVIDNLVRENTQLTNKLAEKRPDVKKRRVARY